MKRIRVKPGKSQSMMGFAAGILFCLIGVFVVIPIFGLFGIFWTAMAGLITITSGLNAFSDRGVASHEILIEDTEQAEKERDGADSDAAAEDLRQSVAIRLKAAEELYESGTITAEEYEAKRREILSGL